MGSMYERTENMNRGTTFQSASGWLFPSQGTTPGTGGLNFTYSGGYTGLPLVYDTWAGSNPPALTFEVMRPEYILITVKGKSVGAETGNLVFNFAGRCAESDPWTTVPVKTVTLTLTGATLAVKSEEFLVKGFAELKLINITTTCVTSLEAINCKISWKI